jgi:hypothetical protein
MKVIATAKIIAARTMYLDCPPLLSAMAPLVSRRPGADDSPIAGDLLGCRPAPVNCRWGARSRQRPSGEDAATSRRRRSLVSSQLVGLAWTRYVVRMEPLASADRAEVAAWAGPTIDRYATGKLDPEVLD